MADELDTFLADALAPPERAPDRAFVAKVQARIALDERLREARAALLKSLGLQLLGLAAVVAGALWIGRSPAVSGFAAESPQILLAILIGLFSFLVLLFSPRAGDGRAFGMPQRAFSRA